MIASLPRRQRQVFIQRALGRANKGIAIDLGINVSGVGHHFDAVRAKLGIAPYDIPAFVRIAAGPHFFASK